VSAVEEGGVLIPRLRGSSNWNAGRFSDREVMVRSTKAKLESSLGRWATAGGETPTFPRARRANGRQYTHFSPHLLTTSNDN
jgi:hypothetical protein